MAHRHEMAVNSSAMPQAPAFVVVDYHGESRFLLAKTLRRKFPDAVIHESEDAEKAVEIARAINLAAIVTHRTHELRGVELVRRLREADPQVPIVMVSGIDREAEALAAGASSFLNYDEWLRIGSVVEARLRRAGGRSAEDTAVV
jgi:CheY-like chemotaxis protein